MNRFFGIEKRVLKLVKPIAEPLIDVPLPSDEVLDRIQELYVKIGKLKEILESDDTTVRIVMNPEKMVIRESERAFTYLNLFGYRVDCVIVNKIFPKHAGDYFARWTEIQEAYLKEIEEKFPLPIFRIPFKSTEITGDTLFELSDELYGEKDPTEVFYAEKPMRIEKEGEDFVLAIKAPFVKKEDLKLLKRGEELIIVAGQWKRVVFLPQSLALKEPSGASFKNNELRITFR
jgi:arsenite-transporting ATPase